MVMTAKHSEETLRKKRFRKVTGVGGEKQKDVEVPFCLKHFLSPFMVYHIALVSNFSMVCPRNPCHMPFRSLQCVWERHILFT